MNQHLQISRVDTPNHPVKKLRAVVFGSGLGMFPPLMARFRTEFEIVAELGHIEMPKFYRRLFFLLSVRWPRIAWYRKWMYYLEKTSFSFQICTREAARKLKPLEGKYDVILFFGAMYAPGESKKPLFVFTDSCRWLSANNPYDEISHFRSARHRTEWLSYEAAVYNSANRIFVGSDFVRQAIVDNYGVNAERVLAIGFGPGIGFGTPVSKTFDGRSILFIGQGDFVKKGGAVLLDAFRQVRETIPDAVLHVVGQDRLPDMPGVISHGFVRDRNVIVKLMQQAHVLTLPSLTDRFGIVLVEAMAASTPCVASNYGAMPGIVGNAGLIVPTGDAPALRDAIVSILQDRALSARLGTAGKRRYEEKYNWESIWQTVSTEMQSALKHLPS